MRLTAEGVCGAQPPLSPHKGKAPQSPVSPSRRVGQLATAQTGALAGSLIVHRGRKDGLQNLVCIASTPRQACMLAFSAKCATHAPTLASNVLKLVNLGYFMCSTNSL